MSVARLAVSFDEELARAVRRAAGKEPTSSWLADAARRKLHCSEICAEFSVESARPHRLGALSLSWSTQNVYSLRMKSSWAHKDQFSLMPMEVEQSSLTCGRRYRSLHVNPGLRCRTS